MKLLMTTAKFNSKRPRKFTETQKERIVSGLPTTFFFRGELLNFGGVSIVAPKLEVQKNTFLSLFWVAISYIQTSISYPYNFRYVRMHFRRKFLGDQVDGGSELLQLFGIFINRITCNYYLYVSIFIDTCYVPVCCMNTYPGSYK